MEDILRDRVLRNTIDTLRALTNQHVYLRRKSQIYTNLGGQQFCPTVGMKVYWWCPAAIKVINFDGIKQTVSKKLANTWTGPWVVMEMLSDQISKISELVKGKQNRKNTRTVSIDRFEEYREGYSYIHSEDTVIPLPDNHILSLDAETTSTLKTSTSTCTMMERPETSRAWGVTRTPSHTSIRNPKKLKKTLAARHSWKRQGL